MGISTGINVNTNFGRGKSSTGSGMSKINSSFSFDNLTLEEQIAKSAEEKAKEEGKTKIGEDIATTISDTAKNISNSTKSELEAAGYETERTIDTIDELIDYAKEIGFNDKEIGKLSDSDSPVHTFDEILEDLYNDPKRKRIMYEEGMIKAYDADFSVEVKNLKDLKTHIGNLESEQEKLQDAKKALDLGKYKGLLNLIDDCKSGKDLDERAKKLDVNGELIRNTPLGILETKTFYDVYKNDPEYQKLKEALDKGLDLSELIKNFRDTQRGLNEQASEIDKKLANIAEELSLANYVYEQVDIAVTHQMENIDPYIYKDDFDDKSTFNKDTLNTLDKVLDRYIAKNGQVSVNDKEAADILLAIINGEGTGYNDKTIISNNKVIEHYKKWAPNMTADEIKVANYIYNTQGAAALLAFANGSMVNTMDNRWLQVKREKDANFAKDNKFLASLGSIVVTPVEGIVAAIHSTDVIYRKKVLKEEAKILRTDVYSSGTVWRMAVSRDILENSDLKYSKQLASAYDIGMSMADSLSLVGVNVLTGGTATPLISAALMGSRAYVSTLNDALDRGLSDGQAVALAYGSATVETLMESWSASHLFNLEKKLGIAVENIVEKSGKKFTSEAMQKIATKFTYITAGAISQGLVEGEEELSTEVLNYVWDMFIAKDLSTYKTTIDKYTKLGYSEENAQKEALKDLGENMKQAFTGGFISGICFGLGGAGKTTRRMSKMLSSEIYDKFEGNNYSEKFASALKHNREQIELLENVREETTKANIKNAVTVINHKIKSKDGAITISTNKQEKLNTHDNKVDLSEKDFSLSNSDYFEFTEKVEELLGLSPFTDMHVKIEDAMYEAIQNAKNLKNKNIKFLIENIAEILHLNDVSITTIKGDSFFGNNQLNIDGESIDYNPLIVFFHEAGHAVHRLTDKGIQNGEESINVIENLTEEQIKTLENARKNYKLTPEREKILKESIARKKTEITEKALEKYLELKEKEEQRIEKLVDSLYEKSEKDTLRELVEKYTDSEKYNHVVSMLQENGLNPNDIDTIMSNKEVLLKVLKKGNNIATYEKQRSILFSDYNDFGLDRKISSMLNSLFMSDKPIILNDGSIFDFTHKHDNKYFDEKGIAGSFGELMADYLSIQASGNQEIIDTINTILGEDVIRILNSKYEEVANYMQELLIKNGILEKEDLSQEENSTDKNISDNNQQGPIILNFKDVQKEIESGVLPQNIAQNDPRVIKYKEQQAKNPTASTIPKVEKLSTEPVSESINNYVNPADIMLDNYIDIFNKMSYPEFNNFLNSDYGRDFLNFSRSELEAVSAYFGEAYASVNNYFRGISDYNQYIDGLVKNIESLMAKYGGLREDKTLFRGIKSAGIRENTTLGRLLSGIDKSNINELYSRLKSLEGKIIIEEGYLSTSTEESAIPEFERCDIEFKINAKKGLQGIDGRFLSSKGESEFLGARDTALHVTNVEVDYDSVGIPKVIIEADATNDFKLKRDNSNPTIREDLLDSLENENNEIYSIIETEFYKILREGLISFNYNSTKFIREAENNEYFKNEFYNMYLRGKVDNQTFKDWLLKRNSLFGFINQYNENKQKIQKLSEEIYLSEKISMDNNDEMLNKITMPIENQNTTITENTPPIDMAKHYINQLDFMIKNGVKFEDLLYAASGEKIIDSYTRKDATIIFEDPKIEMFDILDRALNSFEDDKVAIKRAKKEIKNIYEGIWEKPFDQFDLEEIRLATQRQLRRYGMSENGIEEYWNLIKFKFTSFTIIDPEDMFKTLEKYMTEEETIRLSELANKNTIKLKEMSKSLTEEVHNAILVYTRQGPGVFNAIEIDDPNYVGLGFTYRTEGLTPEEMIKKQYEEAIGKNAYIGNHYKALINFINENKINKTVKVYRFVKDFGGLKKLSDLKIGAYFKNQGFTSTTISIEDYLRMFPKGGGVDILLEIIVPEGSCATYIEPFSGTSEYFQNEFLLAPKSTLTIIEDAVDKKVENKLVRVVKCLLTQE